MRFTFYLFCVLLTFSCASKPATTDLEILPCYKAKSFEEFDNLSALRAKTPGQPLQVKGKAYACVENSQTVETNCYVAKSKKEFKKLSREQEKHHGRPVKVGRKFYLCIQESR